MNIVITINLGGNAYQLEKGGYDALRDYLDTAARRLEGNPDRDEIVADIEQAIAEKFRAMLNSFKSVIVAKEVDEVIREMGPVQDEAGEPDETGPTGGTPRAASGAGEPAGAAAAGTPARRLYKIREGSMVGGVCTGLGAYFNVDVTVIRLLFAVLIFTWGMGLLLYLVMYFLVPYAQTPAEKAAAAGGGPSTAEEFIRRAKEGYYEGMKTFHDKHAHRAWKRKFKEDMRGWSRDFSREMHSHAQNWRTNWRTHWGPPEARGPGFWFTLPILTVFTVALTLAGIFAVLSLIATGAVFGIVLPASMPLWVGILFVLVAVNLLLWPFRAMRHALWYHGSGRSMYPGPMVELWNSFAWLAMMVLLVWLADRYVPRVHEALESVRPQVQHALDAIRQWWAAR